MKLCHLRALAQTITDRVFPDSDSATNSPGLVVSARRVLIPDEVSGKIVLPAARLKKLPAEEEEKVLGVFNRAVGKESKVEYIGTGEPPFHVYLLIVLDESENLEQLKVNASVLVGTRTRGPKN